MADFNSHKLGVVELNDNDLQEANAGGWFDDFASWYVAKGYEVKQAFVEGFSAGSSGADATR